MTTHKLSLDMGALATTDPTTMDSCSIAPAQRLDPKDLDGEISQIIEDFSRFNPLSDEEREALAALLKDIVHAGLHDMATPSPDGPEDRTTPTV